MWECLKKPIRLGARKWVSVYDLIKYKTNNLHARLFITNVYICCVTMQLLWGSSSPMQIEIKSFQKSHPHFFFYNFFGSICVAKFSTSQQLNCGNSPLKSLQCNKFSLNCRRVFLNSTFRWVFGTHNMFMSCIWHFYGYKCVIVWVARGDSMVRFVISLMCLFLFVCVCFCCVFVAPWFFYSLDHI